MYVQEVHFKQYVTFKKFGQDILDMQYLSLRSTVKGGVF